MSGVGKVANLLDESSNSAFEVFRFVTVSGAIQHIRIERECARDVKHVYRALLKANADLPSNEATTYHLIQQAIETDGHPSLKYATRLGWQARTSGFMFGNRFIDHGGKEATLLPPPWADSQPDTPLHTAGSLRDWQSLVARQLTGSARLDMLMAAAFAAPLVRFTGEPNPGLNLIGLTWPELEIAAALVGSILGQRAYNAVSEWWVKPPTLIRRAQHFNDLLFVAGSLRCCPERMETSQQHERVLSLRSGRARTGMVRSGQVEQPEAPWHGIFVSMLPYPIRRCDPGGVVSGAFDPVLCCDIPPAGHMSALIDQPQPRKTAAELKPIGLQLLRMADGARHQRGTPIRHYVRHLVKHRRGMARRVTQLRAEFCAQPANAALGRSVAPALNCFALLYAGGCLAIEAGVLPWRRTRLAKSLHECLAATVRHANADILTPKLIRRTLRARLQSPAVVERTSKQRFGPEERDGFFEMVGGRRRYTVHATAFRSWFGSSARCSTALTWLHKHALLVMGSKPHMPHAQSVEWAERTPRWPDGRVQKSFVFYDIPAGTGRKSRAR